MLHNYLYGFKSHKQRRHNQLQLVLPAVVTALVTWYMCHKPVRIKIWLNFWLTLLLLCRQIKKNSGGLCWSSGDSLSAQNAKPILSILANQNNVLCCSWIRLIDWLVLTACQLVHSYLMPRNDGIQFIVHSYLHFLYSYFSRDFAHRYK